MGSREKAEGNADKTKGRGILNREAAEKMVLDFMVSKYFEL